jgi:hypothetical protein
VACNAEPNTEKEAAGLTEDENGVSKPTCLEERGYGRCILIASLGILSCTDMPQRLSAPQYSEETTIDW